MRRSFLKRVESGWHAQCLLEKASAGMFVFWALAMIQITTLGIGFGALLMAGHCIVLAALLKDVEVNLEKKEYIVYNAMIELHKARQEVK